MEAPMTRNLSTAATRRILMSALTMFALATAFPQSAFANATRNAEIWKVNVAKSKFSAGSNTLVIDLIGQPGKLPRPDIASGDSTASTFLFLSNGKVYLATPPAAYGAASGDGVKTVDYTRLRDMSLEQIGENVRFIDDCGYWCKMGRPNNRVTLSFTSVGGAHETGDMLVYRR
jgi:hypothetical protein